MSTPNSKSSRRLPAFFSRLRVRLLFLVFLAVLPILGLVLYTSIEERTQALSEAKASALRLVRMAASEQKQHIEAGRQLLITLAQLSEVRQSDAGACEALFTNLLTVHRIYANFGLIGPDGQLVASGIPGRRAYLG